MIRMPKSVAVRHLERVRDQIQTLEGCSTDSPAFMEWRRNARIAIENVFGKDSDEVGEFDRVNFYSPSVGVSLIGHEAEESARNERWKRESFENGLIRSQSLLNSMIEQIMTFGLDENDDVTHHDDPKDVNLTSTRSSNSISETETMKVFISHSSKDVELVSSIVNLIQKSTRISSDDIRCTSLDGHRLEGGATTNEAIRAEVCGFKLLVGLITPNALNSLFVIFELGARWGAVKPMIPLLASGTTTDDLDGPLAEINALDCTNESQVIQFVENVACHMEVSLESPSSYIGEVTKVVEASSKLYENVQQEQSLALFRHIAAIAIEFLLAATKNRNGTIHLLETAGGAFVMSAGCKNETTEEHRTGSEWRSAIRQLEEKKWVIDCSGNGTVFEVTGEGYAVADELRNKSDVRD